MLYLLLRALRLGNFGGPILQYGPLNLKLFFRGQNVVGRLFRNVFKRFLHRQRKTTGNFTRWRKFAKLSCGFRGAFRGNEQELEQDKPDSRQELFTT